METSQGVIVIMEVRKSCGSEHVGDASSVDSPGGV